MNRKLLFIFMSVLILITFSNCHLFKKADDQDRIDRKREDFHKFYDRFHEDIDFQRSRVKFPLGGLMIDNDNEMKWTPENYPLMKVKIYDIDEHTYNVSFQLTEDTFIQKVSLKNSGLFAEYRFERIKDKWYLVYIMDQNL